MTRKSMDEAVDYNGPFVVKHLVNFRKEFTEKRHLEKKTVADPRGMPPARAFPTDQNFLKFMQFLGKNGKFVSWRPLLLRGILDPPLKKRYTLNVSDIDLWPT